jgi:hypothetical protein
MLACFQLCYKRNFVAAALSPTFASILVSVLVFIGTELKGKSGENPALSP